MLFFHLHYSYKVYSSYEWNVFIYRLFATSEGVLFLRTYCIYIGTYFFSIFTILIKYIIRMKGMFLYTAYLRRREHVRDVDDAIFVRGPFFVDGCSLSSPSMLLLVVQDQISVNQLDMVFSLIK